ncbi:MAG: cupin domain-containing protein [Candidatus Binatia bacterium]
MGLHVRSEDVPERKRVHNGEKGWGSMVVKKVYGNECDLMVAVRAPGYRTRPHFHESDQINYIVEGEIWYFVEEEGFHCKKGDFVRIPSNKIQWEWNRSKGQAVVIETHAPPMIGGQSIEGAVGLFGEAEKPAIKGPAENAFVSYDTAAVQKKYNLD